MVTYEPLFTMSLNGLAWFACWNKGRI